MDSASELFKEKSTEQKIMRNIHDETKERETLRKLLLTPLYSAGSRIKLDRIFYIKFSKRLVQDSISILKQTALRIQTKSS